MDTEGGQTEITEYKGWQYEYVETIAVDMIPELNILLTEDDDLNAETAIEPLKVKRTGVHRAGYRKRTVELLVQNSPGAYQATFMSTQMHEMNGLEACRVIRGMQGQDASSIPVIAVMVNSYQEDAGMAAEAGMDGLVIKPVDVEYLCQVSKRAQRFGQSAEGSGLTKDRQRFHATFRIWTAGQ